MDNADLSPFLLGNSHPSFELRSSASAMSQDWMSTPSSEISDYASLGSGDGSSPSSDTGYSDAYRPSMNQDNGFRNEWDGRKTVHFIEQCTAEHCFFGCKGNHGSIINTAERYVPLTPDRGYHSTSDLFDIETERAFGNTFALASDNFARRRCLFFCYKVTHHSSFSPRLQASSLAYHARRASVPSYPTHSILPRHRRLSEPYNTPSAQAKKSIDAVPDKISARKEGHDQLKAKDHPKPILFKTELCRSWEEKGSCRYGFVFDDPNEN